VAALDPHAGRIYGELCDASAPPPPPPPPAPPTRLPPPIYGALCDDELVGAVGAGVCVGLLSGAAGASERGARGRCAAALPLALAGGMLAVLGAEAPFVYCGWLWLASDEALRVVAGRGGVVARLVAEDAVDEAAGGLLVGAAGAAAAESRADVLVLVGAGTKGPEGDVGLVRRRFCVSKSCSTREGIFEWEEDDVEIIVEMLGSVR
jgi:hypothetical protein